MRKSYKTKDKETINDEKVSWFIGVYFISSIANMTMKTILPIPESLRGIVSLFWGVVILFFMLRGLKIVIWRSKKIIYGTFLIFFVIFVWSFFLITLRGEPTTVLTSEIAIPTLLFWIPIGLFARSIYDFKNLYSVMLKASYICLVLLILCFLFRRGIYDDGSGSYNMFFGYSMAFTSLFHLNQFYRSKNIIFLLLFVFQFFLILFYANRGALLSVAFFVFGKFVLDQGNTIKRIAGILLISFFSLLIAVFAERFANAILDNIGIYNIDSRTLSKIASGTLDENDPREELQEISIKMIYERPLLGWGVGGECYTIGSLIAPDAELNHGQSPHNGILQHMLYFGIIIGSIFNIFLFFPLLKLYKVTDLYQRDTILITCSAYLITTLVSSCDILLKPAVAIYIYIYYFSKKEKYLCFMNK